MLTLIKWIAIILTVGAGAALVSCTPSDRQYTCTCNRYCDLEVTDTDNYDVCAGSEDGAEAQAREVCEMFPDFTCFGTEHCGCICNTFGDGC